MVRRVSFTFYIKTVQRTARLMHSTGGADYSILEVGGRAGDGQTGGGMDGRGGRAAGRRGGGAAGRRGGRAAGRPIIK